MSIQNYFPGAKPTLLLDFSNTKNLDTRVQFTRPTTGPTVVGTGVFYDSLTVTKSDENLLVYTQEFNNPAWVASNITVVADVVDVAPDDTTTAETFTATAANGTVTQSLIISGVSDYTFSVYLKRRTGTGNIEITCNSSGTWVTQSITSSWARYTVTQNLSAGTITPGIRIVTNGDAIDVWGAQLEQRNFSTFYRQTIGVPVTAFVSTLKVAPENTPRVSHNPVSRFPLGLVVESTSTNLITYSEDFSNAIYNYTNCSVVTNQAIAPSGNLAGDKLVIGSGTGINCFNFVSLSISSATTYTISCYAKRNEYIYLFLGFNTSASEYAAAQFNLDTGTVQFSGASGAGYSVIGTNISNVTNGWYKCAITLTSNNTTENIMISPASVVWTGSSRPGSGQNGNNFNGIFTWGAQFENFVFATSYIYTNGSAITRNGDTAVVSGTNLNAVVNQSNGVFVCVYSPITSQYSPIVSLDDNSADNEITVYTESGQAKFKVVNETATQCLIISGTANASLINKTAVRYARNLFAASTNFAVAVNDFVGYPPEVITHMRIGSDYAGNKFNGAILKIAYYPVTAFNFQLKNLTV